MEKILSVENLCTSFTNSSGQIRAVRGVSFSVSKGQTLGIVGESGSGKSVTSMSILRLLAQGGRVVDGSIIFDGQDLTKATDKQIRNIRGARIAMIFQDPMTALNPLMTVGQQVAEMFKQHQGQMSRAAIKQEVIKLFEMVKIPEPEKRYNAYPHEFSGGMRQRVMIAMALALKPDVLIADEPTTALDVTIQAQILKLLKSIQEEMGMAILFITHDLGVVAELCQQVIVMYGGLIMEEGGIDQIFEKPSHPYTMGLLNSMPEVTQDKAKRLTPIPGSPPDMTNPPAGCPFAPRCAYARNICAQELPPYYTVGDGHRTLCHLHDPEAPATDNPFKKAGENHA